MTPMKKGDVEKVFAILMGAQKVLPCRGGRKKFRTRDFFPFCSDLLPVINNQSLSCFKSCITLITLHPLFNRSALCSLCRGSGVCAGYRH